MRWSLKLAEYDYDVLHKPGKLHVDADALSRLPSSLVQEENSTDHVSTAALINISAVTKLNAAPTFTMEVIQAEQNKDETCRNLLKDLKRDKFRQDKPAYLSKYKIQNNILMARGNGKRVPQDAWRIVLPPSLRYSAL